MGHCTVPGFFRNIFTTFLPPPGADLFQSCHGKRCRKFLSFSFSVMLQGWSEKMSIALPGSNSTVVCRSSVWLPPSLGYTQSLKC